MNLWFDLNQFVDSDLPARKPDGNLVSETEWQKIIDELMRTTKVTQDKDLRIESRAVAGLIACGIKTQAVYNKYKNLI